jgi:hypothetical protein
MKRLICISLCVSLAVITLSWVVAAQKHSYVPPRGFVPDQQTAGRIAEAVWIPIYGEEHIKSERPFKARLENDVWTVEGTLPKGFVGGVAIAEISKSDGRILRVSHGK